MPLPINDGTTTARISRTFCLCQTPQRQYMIEADFFRGIKGKEFSIFDRTGKNLKYRIESKYHILHNLELIAYPSKQVVGKLKAKFKPLMYEGTFEVVDDQSQQWVKGTINQNFQWLGHRWMIGWNGRRLSMETEPVSLTTHFFDEQQGRSLLAKCRLRMQSFVWVNKYDMEVYSNSIPDAVYLLSLAAQDHTIRGRKNG